VGEGVLDFENWETFSGLENLDPYSYEELVATFLFIGSSWLTSYPGGGAVDGGVDYFNLRLRATSDNCNNPNGRLVNYVLTTSSGTPITSPNYYVYEIQSAQSLARGGPFPGTTVGKNPNTFDDWINPGISTGTSIQQFGVSLTQPNASGAPGGHLVMINWFGNVVGQNIIQLPSQGNILINGKPCP